MRMRNVQSLGDRVDVGKVFHDEGVVRIEKEAVAVRREHFEELLNGGEEI